MRDGVRKSGDGAWPPASRVSSELSAHPSCNARAEAGRDGASASATSARPVPADISMVLGVTGFTSASTVNKTSASGVNFEIVCIASDTAIARLTLLHPELQFSSRALQDAQLSIGE